MPDRPLAQNGRRLPLQCHPGTKWVVETRGTALLRTDTGASAELGYPDAALWDFVVRNVEYPRMVAMIAALAHCDSASASAWIEGRFRQWTDDGWLEDGDVHG